MGSFKCPLACGIIIFAMVVVAIINVLDSLSGILYVVLGGVAILVICCCCLHVRLGSE